MTSERSEYKGRNNSSILFLFACAATTIVCGQELYKNILPYFFEIKSGTLTLYTFVPDNFYSFSSVIYRRALPGEVIYYLDVLTGNGPLAFSFIIFMFSAFIVFLIFREAAETLTPPECFLLMLTPIVLNYKIDGEIFLFIPFISILFMKGQARDILTLFLIGVAITIRSVAFIFFLPVVLYLIFNGRSYVRVFAALVLAAATAFLFAPKPDPTYLLETTYWPDQGYGDLKETYEYMFVEWGLSDIIRFHIELLDGHVWSSLIGMFAITVLSVVYIVKRSENVALATYYILMIMFFSIVSIDYGRYYYVYFGFAILSTHAKATDYFSFAPFPQILDRFLPDTQRRISDALLSVGSVSRAIMIAFFALCPVGYWAAETSFPPRLLQLFGDIIDHVM